jgi:hypothetical protein
MPVIGALVLLIYIFLAYSLGKFAKRKGRSFFKWFFIGLVIYPILAAILFVNIYQK